MTFTGAHAIAHGDVLSVLRELPDNEFDAALFDPPYGFSFMGKKWDYDVPGVEVFRELLRVLKPGAPVVSFGGTRTFHRVSVNIEDGGFELRDVLMWMYGSGFPKSLDVSKAIDAKAGAKREVVGAGHRKATGRMNQGEGGYAFAEDYSLTAPSTPLAQQWAGYGTALKPAWEPAILARKPLEGTVAANIEKWGCGALAIDACRIEGPKTPAPTSRVDSVPWFTAVGQDLGGDDSKGRWPANLAMDEEAGAALDEQTSGMRCAKPSNTGEGERRSGGSGFQVGASKPSTMKTHGGEGASRFFYSAKVSTKEREWGCEALSMKSAAEMTDSEDGQARLASPRTGAGRGGGARNHHPTLKPIALARWLASLIKPPTPGAQLLVPFSGAGSEMIGALEAGWPAVFGIEGEAEYIDIAHARIAAWAKGSP